MRSKHPLNTPDLPPLLDWVRAGDTAVAGPPRPHTVPERPHALTPRSGDMRVLWDRMVGGWLLLGIKAGAVVGALFGLFGGPAGFVIGAIAGAFFGGFLAAPVILQAVLIYGVRHVAGRPPRTTGQHIRVFVTLPAILLTIPLLLSPTSALITGPPLATGLMFGPRVVRNALRPVDRSSPRPPDVFNDSPQEVTS